MAEKAFKALLIYLGVEFPYSHDLSRLLTRLENAGQGVPKYVRQAARLTRFAVGTRYPGLSSSRSEREDQTAVRLADAALRWTTRQIERIKKKKGE